MIDQLIKPVSDILDKFVADKDLKLKTIPRIRKRNCFFKQSADRT